VSESERLLLIYRERVDGYTDVDDEFVGRWLAWCRMVLAHGGELVVPPLHPEPDLDRLLADSSMHGPQVRALQGDGNCHAKVAGLWFEGRLDVIGSGYALHDDGLWRQHSWGIWPDGVVLETKWAFVKYFGLTLAPGEPTVLFALNNYAGDVRELLKQGTGRAKDIVEVLQAARARRAMDEGAKPTA
jgi:hypothetical protein